MLVRFKDTAGRTFYLNPAQVCSFGEWGENGTAIIMTNDHGNRTVSMTPDEVARRIMANDESVLPC